MVQLFKPCMGDEEIEAVAEVIRSGWLGLGPKTAEFEKKLAEYIEVPYMVALNSCTAALDLAIRLLDIGPGDEVIVPAHTFVSTAHAVLYNGASPVFADVDPITLNLDPEDVVQKITSRTRAIIVVHFAGRPVDMDRLEEAAGEIPIIEDVAHAFGAEYKGKKCGSLGMMGCFSFQAVKNLAVGDGGALCLNNHDSFLRGKKLRWMGIDKGTFDRTSADQSYWWEYNVDEVGFKSHMNDISAAIGLAQLQKIPQMNARRTEIARRYTEGLSSLLWLTTPPVDTLTFKSSWHIYCIQIEEKRNELNAFLRDKGIGTGVHYKPIHLYNCYEDHPYLPITEKAFERILSLPMHPGLSDADVDHVIECIWEFNKLSFSK